jgi:hypothetical protein
MILSSLVLFLLSSDGQVQTLPEKNGTTAYKLTFDDLDGEHAITFTLGPVKAKLKGEERLVSRRLDVVHLWKKTPKHRFFQLWSAKDFVVDCPFDLTFKLFKESIRVSDVNANGKTEVVFAYVTGCRSDVSPDTMKVLLYEGKEKFALRGQNKIQVGVDEKDKPTFAGGEFKADQGFPPKFLPIAQTVWNEFVSASTTQ